MKLFPIDNIYFATHAEKETAIAMRRRIRSYALGFIFSIILTVLAYLFVVLDLSFLSDTTIIGALVWCAAAQFFIQMTYFLHVGSGSRPRWNLFMVALTLILLFIIVGGSLWIMTSLDDRMMAPPPEGLPAFEHENVRE